MEPDYQTGIIGAGFGGIIAALKLLEAGRKSFVLFERAHEIGGTWRDNTYPGCACDIPSVLYSISAEPNPNRSRRYSPQPEILAYLKSVVAKHQLEQYLRFDSEIIDLEYEEQNGFWKLRDRHGRSTTVRAVILALGPFQKPSLPNLSGMETFQGKIVHSAKWDNNLNIKEQRVAVIGTGASGIQIVPAIAPEVAHLTVFQRTPSWISDRYDTEVSALAQQIFRKLPLLQHFLRKAWYRFLEYRGGLFFGKTGRYRFFEKLCLKKLEREVSDPEVRRKLTPNYAMGCKRIVVSDDYLPAFNRPNVSLESSGIDRITPRGILTKEGVEIPFDLLIFATGFEVIDYNSMKIKGKSGRELYKEWKQSGISAYKGTVVSGYPNFFTLLGPNSGFGHNSVLLAMEAQMEYVLQYLRQLDQLGRQAALDLNPEIQRRYNETMQQKFKGTVWASGCRSWYLDEHGRNPVIYPGLMDDFRKETQSFEPRDYEVVNADAPHVMV